MEYQAFHNIPWQHGSFWVFIAIVIFAVLFGRRIATPITGMLDRRAVAVREALAEAARLKAEAEMMLAQAKARQEQAARDARDILEAAHDEAARLARDLRQDAEAAARWRERLALERITAAEQAAVNEVRAAAIEIASRATAETLREDLPAAADAALVDQAISALPKALRQAV